jgi:hypothetical protein
MRLRILVLVRPSTYLVRPSTYFPAHKIHFFFPKKWSKFDLRLMRLGYVLFTNLNASSENNHEDEFSGSDDDFLGLYDE